MALHTYTFTPTQSRMLKEILYDEMKKYEDLLEQMIDEPVRKIIEDDLVMMKTMYSQIIKKL